MLKDWEGNGRFSYYLSEARLRITFSNYPRTEPAMDIRGWKSLWKVFAIIGIANLYFLFCYFICIHARRFYTSLDPGCYRIYMLPRCFDCASTYSSTSALILILSQMRYTMTFIIHLDLAYTIASNLRRKV
jgi:hypothetical protein